MIVSLLSVYLKHFYRHLSANYIITQVQKEKNDDKGKKGECVCECQLPHYLDDQVAVVSE